MKATNFIRRFSAVVIAASFVETTIADEPKPVDAKARAELQQAARARMAKDRDAYSRQELGELEELYQIANKNWKTDKPKAKEAMEELVKKYKQANRTGCAMLYLGQLSYGDERDKYLDQAIKNFSDCYYGNGVQVGGWARFLRLLDLKSDGKDKEADKIEKVLRSDYKTAINHSGILLIDLLDRQEQEEK